MPPDVSIRSLDTPETLEEARHRSHDEPVVLFKHSATCPISSHVDAEISTLSAEADPPVYRLVVQQARPLSNAIAETFGIRHESPQAIVLYRDTPVFHASHYGVTADALRTAAREARVDAAAS